MEILILSVSFSIMFRKDLAKPQVLLKGRDDLHMQNKLSTRTPAEREEHIQFLISLPLNQLRHRQDLVKSQQRKTFDLLMADKGSPFQVIREGAEAKWDPVFDQLDQMWNDLFEAIDRKCFPQPKWGGGMKEQPVYGATN